MTKISIRVYTLSDTQTIFVSVLVVTLLIQLSWPFRLVKVEISFVC